MGILTFCQSLKNMEVKCQISIDNIELSKINILNQYKGTFNNTNKWIKRLQLVT